MEGTFKEALKNNKGDFTDLIDPLKFESSLVKVRTLLDSNLAQLKTRLENVRILNTNGYSSLVGLALEQGGDVGDAMLNGFVGQLNKGDRKSLDAIVKSLINIKAAEIIASREAKKLADKWQKEAEEEVRRQDRMSKDRNPKDNIDTTKQDQLNKRLKNERRAQDDTKLLDPSNQGTIKPGKNMNPYQPYRDWETDRKSTRLNSSHSAKSRMPSSA